MKKFLPLALGAVVAVFLNAVPVQVQAEDPKVDPDLWDDDIFGFKVSKPKGKDQWKFVGRGGWKPIFEQNEDRAVFFLQKWQSDNLEGNPQKSPPLVTMYAMSYETQVKIKVGKWEGTAGQTKGFAKAIFDDVMATEYKDPKNIAETDKVTYPCGKVAQFSCYAVSRKYSGSFYTRFMVVKGEGNNTFLLRVVCPPKEELLDDKHSGKEIEEVLRSIRFYEVKK